MSFSLVFTRRFSMAHRLLAGDSDKCAVPHGHNELVVATLQASGPRRLDGASNMVEPFERQRRVGIAGSTMPSTMRSSSPIATR